MIGGAVVVVLLVLYFGWRMASRPKKPSITFGTSTTGMTPRDRMAQEIMNSARTNGGPAPQTAPAPGNP